MFTNANATHAQTFDRGANGPRAIFRLAEFTLSTYAHYHASS